MIKQPGEIMTNSKPTPPYDFTEPIQIAPDSYWVGNREDLLMNNNIYLRVFKGEGQRVNLIIDPGPPKDLSVLMQKVAKVIDDIVNVDLVFINHQDPDVALNARVLQKLNPKLSVICSGETWRLIKFYNLNPKLHIAVESFKDRTFKLATGHELSFVPSPFCHFCGAVMLFDRETRVLYTGDLFGGLSYGEGLYVDGSYWEGLKTYHQIFMPTVEAFKLAVRNIRALEPSPMMLAPQHGNIIAGEWVPNYINRLETLRVGIDLLLDSENKENYITAMNELLLELSPLLGPEKIISAMRSFQTDDSFMNIIHLDSSRGVIDIKVEPRAALDIFLQGLIEQSLEEAKLIEDAAMKIILGRNITSLPSIFLAK